MNTGSHKIIAIASGKGGTGKTTIAAHLAIMAARKQITVLLDLDVEAPDILGYFKEARKQGEAKTVHVLVPRLVESKCTGCGRCASSCRFGAIIAIGGVVTIDQNICKGCGRCVSICPASALEEEPVIVGETNLYEAGSLRILEGCMAIGDIRSTVVIEAAKKQAAAMNGMEFVDTDLSSAIVVEIRDCPPGVSCPATHSIEGASYVVLIAEPTEFSIHDLQAAIQLTRSRNIPTGVVINKEGFGATDVAGFCQREGVPVIGRIAYNHERAVRGASASLWSGDQIVELEMASILRKALQQTTASTTASTTADAKSTATTGTSQ